MPAGKKLARRSFSTYIITKNGVDPVRAVVTDSFMLNLGFFQATKSFAKKIETLLFLCEIYFVFIYSTPNNVDL